MSEGPRGLRGQLNDVDEALIGGLARRMAIGDPRAQARAPELLDWWRQAYRAISPYDAFWKQLAVLNYSYWKDLVRTNDLDLPDSYLTLPMCIMIRDVMIEELEAGLLKPWYPQPADVYHEYRNRPFRQGIMGCLGYLLDLARKSDEHGADGSS
jgi:hypothetical protein